MNTVSPYAISKRIYISHDEKDTEVAKEIQNIIRQWGYEAVYIDEEHEQHFADSQVIIALISAHSWVNTRLRGTWEQPNHDREYGTKKYLRQTFYILIDTFKTPEKLPESTMYNNEYDMGVLKNKIQLHFDMRRDRLSNRSITDDIQQDIQIIANKIRDNLSKDISDDKFMVGEKVEQGDEAILVHRMANAWLNGILIPALAEAESFGGAIQPDIAVISEKYGNFAETIPQNEVDFVKMSTKLDSFLVLGEPGSGKTIFFLQLAVKLLRLYVENWNNKPNKYNLPLILNLSSWGRPEPAYEKFSLEEWILHEVERMYRIDHRKIQEWLGSGRFVLFLDGLDEIADDKRTARIGKINDFNQQKGRLVVKMIVCCRKKEYEQIDKEEKLVFKNIVEMQDLRDEQIQFYMKSDISFIFRDLYDKNIHIQALIKIPFLFIMMKKVSESSSFSIDKANDSNKSEGDWIRYLTDGYVNRQLEGSPHTPERVKKTLEWLGHNMQIYGVVFRIDLINIRWFKPFPYFFVHQALLYAILFVLPIGSAIIFANAVAGIMGATILGGVILIFTLIIYRGFFFNQHYYYDFSHKTFFERLFSPHPSPKMTINQQILIVGGLMMSAVLVWGVPQLIIASNNSVLVFAILGIVWTLVVAIGGYLLFLYLDKPNSAQFVFMAIVPFMVLLVATIYFFNQAFLQYPAFQVMAGTAIPVLIMGMMGTAQGDKTPPLLIKRQTMTPIIFTVALAIGLSFWAILPHGQFWVVLLTLSLACLIVGVVRLVQIHLFYLFIYCSFRLHYHEIMKYLVTKNILRNFAGGFTFRHDYFFQRYIKGTVRETLEAKVNALVDELYAQVRVNPIVDTNTRVIQDLIKLGSPITAQLVEKMSETGNNELLQALAMILKQPSMRATTDIVDRLGYADGGILYYFVDILVQIGDHVTIEAMIPKSTHNYKLVRMKVAQGLRRIDNDKAVDTLINQFKIEQDADVKREIANLLSDSKRRTREIRQLLEDNNNPNK